MPSYLHLQPDITSVRQTRSLPPASFRFAIIHSTVAISCIPPTTGQIRDFPIRMCARQAHILLRLVLKYHNIPQQDSSISTLFHQGSPVYWHMVNDKIENSLHIPPIFRGVIYRLHDTNSSRFPHSFLNRRCLLFQKSK